MKKGDCLEGRVERIDFPNRGIVSADGHEVTVENALPGQTVSFSVGRKRHGKWDGRLLAVLSPAEGEKKSGICPHFGECGGCLYQCLEYGEQLKIKERQVRSLLDPVCGRESCEFEGILASPLTCGYRNKMEFSFGDAVKDGPLLLGLHKRGSFYDIISTDGCELVHPDMDKVRAATAGFFSDAGVSYLKKKDHTGYLRHLLVRRALSSKEMMAALVTTSQTDCLPCDEKKLLDDWCKVLTSLQLEGRLTGVLHIVNDSVADVVKSDRTDILYGRDTITEELLGLTFDITPFSFFQTNSAGAALLYDTVRSYVGDTRDNVIFDLYSGMGTISQVLAPVARKVIGVEIVEEAVEAARASAAENGLTNCEFIAGDVLKVIDEIEERPDMIVLDPPREGIHPRALGKILDFGADSIVYISCKPTSLARDLGPIQEAGYHPSRLCCVDMFPDTANVETVVRLDRKRSEGI